MKTMLKKLVFVLLFSAVFSVEGRAEVFPVKGELYQTGL